jgi:hypothetical protein
MHYGTFPINASYQNMSIHLRYLLFWLAIPIYLISKSQAIRQSSNSLARSEFKDDTLDYAVLIFDIKNTWLFKNAKPTNLTPQDIHDIDELLNKCIAAYNPKQQMAFDSISKKHPDYKLKIQNFVINLSRFKRQYFPVINEKGEKEVWINCFCRADNEDWRNRLISVRDGGNCYFNLKINLTLKTYYDLMVNGDA